MIRHFKNAKKKDATYLVRASRSSVCLICLVHSFFESCGRPEFDHVLGRNVNRLTSLGITSGTGIPELTSERTETDQGHFTVFGKTGFDTVHNGTDYHTSVLLGDSTLGCNEIN
jgi:hypothetical protein